MADIKYPWKEKADAILKVIGDDYINFTKKALDKPSTRLLFSLTETKVPPSGTNIMLKFVDYTKGAITPCYILEFHTAGLFDANKFKGLDGRPGMNTNNKMTRARLRILSAIWQVIEEKDEGLKKYPSANNELKPEVNIYVNPKGELEWWRLK